MAVKKMGVTFFIFFRKRGVTQKGEAPSEKGGTKPGENYVSGYTNNYHPSKKSKTDKYQGSNS